MNRPEFTPEELRALAVWATGYCFRCDEYTAVTVVGESVTDAGTSSLSACELCHWRLYETHWLSVHREPGARRSH
ncbi:hypothetical protein [Streptomyces corynorhini]|uniref:Uncharacterized protein n=1 Tax=Streptomyces corynorhini TaxID=2282652 RepID=A0A370B0F0_9ACTN|nr:hypothetical protein [Streptomyces corynorhini]RDG35061.1 hypothetical protein DVH02_27310 [Streptomyces corynorhini]